MFIFIVCSCDITMLWCMTEKMYNNEMRLLGFAFFSECLPDIVKSI